MPGLVLGQTVPDFEADTTEGPIKFHEWLDGSWAILFSHPADFTPVCCTELAGIEAKAAEFAKRETKLIALSCDSVEAHRGFIDDIKSYGGLSEFSYPIIADPDRKVAELYGMVDPEEKDKAGIPLTARAVFFVGPDKKLKLSILYPATTGRNVPELLRVLDSLHLTAKKSVATPVNWKQGDDCMVVPSVKPEDVGDLFPKGVTVKEMPSGKQYIRITPQP